ncbi:MAG: HAD hydrolase family protein [Muribaculaceae bacterium]|nr:HAD hydrolase family protein [Muribaculaceae bacterium]
MALAAVIVLKKISTFAAMIANGVEKAGTLYVSDLDGTLLGHDSRLSAVTVATLNRIIGELGGLFTVATARTRPRWYR